MTLKGYMKSPARHNGGIRTLALIPCTEVAHALFDDAGRVCTTITLTPGSRFSRYEFREDAAEFTERTTVQKGAANVVHEIVFTLDRRAQSGTATDAMDELLKNDRAGLLALLQAANGETFLVGCSARFGTERPLRVAGNRGTSAVLIKDAASETVTLRSDDTDKAAGFSGDFAALTHL